MDMEEGEELPITFRAASGDSSSVFKRLGGVLCGDLQTQGSKASGLPRVPFSAGSREAPATKSASEITAEKPSVLLENPSWELPMGFF